MITTFAPAGSAACASICQLVGDLIWGAPEALNPRLCLALVIQPEPDAPPVAGVIFHNWRPFQGVMELTAASASRAWLTRPVLREIFDLAFDGCGARIVEMRVSAGNAPMCDIARRFGFSEVRLADFRAWGEDEIVFSLTSRQWAKHRVRRLDGRAARA